MQRWKTEWNIWIKRRLQDDSVEQGTPSIPRLPWMPEGAVEPWGLLPDEEHLRATHLECHVVLGTIQDLIHETKAGRPFTCNVRCRPWNEREREHYGVAPKDGQNNFVQSTSYFCERGSHPNGRFRVSDGLFDSEVGRGYSQGMTHTLTGTASWDTPGQVSHQSSSGVRVASAGAQPF